MCTPARQRNGDRREHALPVSDRPVCVDTRGSGSEQIDKEGNVKHIYYILATVFGVSAMILAVISGIIPAMISMFFFGLSDDKQ